jgi:hypothetical protein
MRRRLLTFAIVAAVTAASTSAWLYDGNLVAAVDPVISTEAAMEWNARALESREAPAPAPAP